MRSKAISPMIATILLIAFTVAVGGIISVWMTSYTRTTGASVSSVTENTTACVGSYPNMVSVTSTALIVTNPGSESLSNLNCFDSSGNNITTIATASLASGATASGAWTRSANTSYVCTARCRNTGVSGECKSGQSCWA